MLSKKRKLYSANTTGYTGVTKVGKRFKAQIVVNKKNKYLGRYETPKEAAVAYDRAVIKYNLPKDKLNWPDGYPKIKSNNATRYRGVTKSGERFVAQISINKKITYLGTYDTPKEAAVAYDHAVIKHNLSKDRLNFPKDNKTSSTNSKEDDDEYDQEQDLHWNSIIEQKDSPFEAVNEITVKKKKENVIFEVDDDEPESLWV